MPRGGTAALLLVAAVACVVSSAKAFSTPLSMMKQAGRGSMARLPVMRSNLLASSGSGHSGVAPALRLKGGTRFAMPAMPRFPPLGWINPVRRKAIGALRGVAGLRATAASTVDAPVEKFRKDYKVRSILRHGYLQSS